jgi:D-alanyl-D-alanine carboxypeptidase/D-alanyl-D-alanine-endopeptidase (penicillin-binding protein 4)
VSGEPELTTELLSYRRMPTQMATAGDDARLSAAMNELASFVDDRSCLSVAVDGRPVIAHNADVPVIPASTHKLLVAAVALEVLGPDHVFTTSVSAPPAVDGVIDGDLVLVGGGDPLLVADDYPIADDSYPAFNTTSLDQLADAVAVAGVTTVNGSVLGDGGRYDDEFVIPSWGPGVAYIEAGPTDALVVNDARVIGRSGRQSDPNEAAAREFARLRIHVVEVIPSMTPTGVEHKMIALIRALIAK